MKIVKVISWRSEDSGELDSWYRVDEPGEGDRFFRDLANNAENDGREKIEYKEVSESAWEDAQRIGATES